MNIKMNDLQSVLFFHRILYGNISEVSDLYAAREYLELYQPEFY